MSPAARRIVERLATLVRQGDVNAWHSLKYQTQFGPEFAEFPYYPAALELSKAAEDAIAACGPAEKTVLIADSLASSNARSDSEGTILNRYSAVILDALISRARSAG